jgi:hypothetical protein
MHAIVGSSAADALRQVLRRVVHGVPRRGPLRRAQRLLHDPRRLRPGNRQYVRPASINTHYSEIPFCFSSSSFDTPASTS